MMSFITSFMRYISWGAISLLFILLCIPLVLLPASIRYQNRWYFRITTLWAKLLVWSGGLTIEIKGGEHLPSYPHDPSLIIMNHTSALDIYLMETIVGEYPHVWLSKASYKKIPLFNILLSRMHVLVDRANPRAALQAVLHMHTLLSSYTTHGLMFPEGSRFSDGKIHDFFVGFALLAQKMKRPVVPIIVWGLHLVYPKGRFIIAPDASTIKVKIGPPLRCAPEETVHEFKKRVQQWCSEALEELKKA